MIQDKTINEGKRMQHLYQSIYHGKIQWEKNPLKDRKGFYNFNIKKSIESLVPKY